jgi:hypothetical protein
MPFRRAFLRMSVSGRGTKAPLAVVVASIVLALGVASGSFAAGLITGADIKDGTVRSADVADGTLRIADLGQQTRSALAATAYSTSDSGDTLLTGAFATILKLRVPTGSYAVTASGIVFAVDQTASAMGQCTLVGPPSDAFNNTATSITAGDQYGTLALQITAAGMNTIRLRCSGTNAGVNNFSVTAIRVRQLHVS